MGNPQLLLGFVSKPGLSILPPHRSEGDSAHGTGISQLLNRMEWEPWGYVVSQTTTVSHGLKVGGRGNSSEEHAFLALVSPEIRTSKINIAFIWWPHRTAQHLKVLPSQIMPRWEPKSGHYVLGARLNFKPHEKHSHPDSRAQNCSFCKQTVNFPLTNQIKQK